MSESLPGVLIAAVLLILVCFGTAAAYLSLRVRDARAEQPDPELGIKVGYHTFVTAGLLLALTGLSIAATDYLANLFDPNLEAQQQPGAPAVVRPPPGVDPRGFPVIRPQAPPPPDDPFGRLAQRVAWPLVISGVLAALVSFLLVKLGTNDARYPATRRTFGGLRLVVGGLTLIFAVTLLIEVMFVERGTHARPMALGVSLLGIWFPVSAVQVFLLKRDGRLPYYVPPKAKPAKRRPEPEEDESEADEDGGPFTSRRRRPADEERPERKEGGEPRPPDRRRPKPRRDDD